MAIYGVCGKPCCGKSFFLKCLDRSKFRIIDCDKLAKLILSQNEDAVKVLLGTVDRREIANIIFHDLDKRKVYLDFIWGKLEEKVRNIILYSRIANATNGVNVLIDAPLLRKSGLVGLCDTVISFETKDDLRLQRATLRGWSREELARRDKFFD